MFSDVVLVSNYHGCEGEAIKLMADIIYKTLKPSHLKIYQIIQNIKDQMFQVIFKFSEWIYIKQIIVSSTPFWCWGKEIFEINSRISLSIGTNGKPLAAIGKFFNANGKLMIGKTLGTSWEEITYAMIGNDVLANYW